MNRLGLLVLLVACSAKQDERCNAFADRVVSCTLDSSLGTLTADEHGRIRSIAYAVCTKSTNDEAALHYYGDVDRKIACMQGKDCAGVRECLTADELSGSAARAQ